MSNFHYYRNSKLIQEHANILIHGYEQVGKKTLATKLVQRMLPYNMTTCEFTHEYFRVETSPNKMSELNTWMRRGKYHIELDFYNTQQTYDVHIMSHILKSHQYTTIGDDGCLHRVYVMLFHFEKASLETQFMLRRIIEKMKNVTFVITTRQLSHVIDSVKSRFATIRLPKTFDVATDENWKNEIYMIPETVPLHEAIVTYRKVTYDLLLIGVEPKDIIKTFMKCFYDSGLFDNHKITQIFAANEHRMVRSSKPIYHIEYAIYCTFTTALLAK